MQVSGRAGRAEKPGEVLIQTAFPSHHLFNALRTQDYPAYAQTLLQEREMAQFPPYCYLALIKAESMQYREVEQFLNFAFELARQLSDQVLTYDPMRAQMEKLKGMERGHILMQATQRSALQKLLAALTPQLRASKLAAKVRWNIDVDPMEF
jgi:primosomal protein N' (replication factor Y)